MNNDFKLLHQVFKTANTVTIVPPSNALITGQVVFNCDNDMVLVGVGAAAQMWQGGVTRFIPVFHLTVGVYTNNSTFSGRGAVTRVSGGTMTEPGSGELIRVNAAASGVVPVRVYFPRSSEPGGAYSIDMQMAGQIDPAGGNVSCTGVLHLYWRLLNEESKGAIQEGGNLDWLSSQAVPEIPKVFHG